MIAFPTPPTDNLYKFMAFTGTILIVISQVGPFVVIHQANEQMRTFTDSFDRSIMELYDKTRAITSEYADARAKVTEWNGPAQKLDNVRLTALDIALNAISSALGSQRLKNTQFGESIKQKVETQLYALRQCGIQGWALAVVGFSLWYWRIQSLQDRILACELKKIRKEAEAS